MFYQYRCPKHGLFEMRRPMSECKLSGICPQCGKESPRRFSTFAFNWGFGGWDFSNGGFGGPRGDEMELRHHQ